MVLPALATGLLTRLLNAKTLIISGLTLFLIGGIGAGYTQTISHLLLFRAILGIGTGLILPFTTGLISQCYKNHEKEKMLGYSFAANNIGAIMGNLFAGLLATISWRAMFSIYWVALPVIVLVIFFLRDLPILNKKRLTIKRLPPQVYYHAISAFSVMVILFIIITNLSFIVEQSNLGSTKTTGILLSANALTMLSAGILFTKTKKLVSLFNPLLLMILSAGLWLLAHASTLPLLSIAIVLIGFSLGSLFPSILNKLTLCTTKSHSIIAISVVMALAWLGQFCAPIIFEFIYQYLSLSVESTVTAFAYGCLLLFANKLLLYFYHNIWASMR
ncbi:MFS transporter [Marinilabiliaceae bacterium JC017]|nr:MFS transporter [Marinilabiliaceae bacterium JC017]